MSRILIVYGTRAGQTQKIAAFMADEMRSQGHSVDVFNSHSIFEEIRPDTYDAVIVGAPVHISNYPKELKLWVRTHSVALSRMPSAFFSVCLGILQEDPKVKAEEEKIVTDFFKWSAWHPQTWAIFAGSLAYTKYNWLVKLLMRYISRKAGVQTDMKKDYEFTDWNQVRKFTSDFCHSVGAAL